MALIHEDLSRQVLGAAFKVHSTLGEGLAEQVYERSMLVELRSRGLLVEQQVSYPVSYQGVAVGVFRADIVVAGTIIVELKALMENKRELHSVGNLIRANPVKIRANPWYVQFPCAVFVVPAGGVR